MVICYKCGKSFSTDQALRYHLTKRKLKCTSLTCSKCNLYLKSNIAFQNHIIACNTKKIVIINDNTDHVRIFENVLNNYPIIRHSDTLSALHEYTYNSFEYLIIDNAMLCIRGADFIKILKMMDKGPERCFIYSTGKIDKRIDSSITFEYISDVKQMCCTIKKMLDIEI